MIFLAFAIFLSVASAQYSDLPPPPQKPERFTSKQQLKEYLVKLHEYYAIIGRPRFGRSSPPLADNKDQQQQQQFEEAMDYDKTAGLDSDYQYEQATSNENKKNENLLLKLLENKKTTKHSIPSLEIIELIDADNDGRTTLEELQKFLSYFLTNNNNNNNISV